MIGDARLCRVALSYDQDDPRLPPDVVFGTYRKRSRLCIASHLGLARLFLDTSKRCGVRGRFGSLRIMKSTRDNKRKNTLSFRNSLEFVFLKVNVCQLGVTAKL